MLLDLLDLLYEHYPKVALTIGLLVLMPFGAYRAAIRIFGLDKQSHPEE